MRSAIKDIWPKYVKHRHAQRCSGTVEPHFARLWMNGRMVTRSKENTWHFVDGDLEGSRRKGIGAAVSRGSKA